MKKIICSLSLIIILLSFTGCNGKNGSKENLFDFKFRINDVTYTLPENIETFTSQGWQLPADFKNFDKIIKPGNLESTYLSEGDNWFNIEIFNGTDKECTLSECKIGRLTYDFSGDVDFVTAGDFSLNGKTLDQVLKEYEEPLSNTEYSTYIEVIYDKDPESGIYDRYTFRFDKNTKIIKHVDIIYFY